MRAAVRHYGPLFAMLLFAGCGQGGPDERGAALIARAVWQNPTSAGSAAQAVSCTGTSPIPSVVVRARVEVRVPSADFACCVAVDPLRFHQQPLVITQLPTGDGQLSLAGFPCGAVPADGAVEICSTEPADAGQPCEPDLCAIMPSYRADPVDVRLEAGVETNAGSICMASSPFIASFTPSCGGVLEDLNDFELAAAQDLGLEDGVEVHILQNENDFLLRVGVRGECLDPPSMQQPSCFDAAGQQACPTVVDGDIQVTGARFVSLPADASPDVGGALVQVVFAPGASRDTGDRAGIASALSDGIVTTYPITILPSRTATATAVNTATPTPSPVDTASPTPTAPDTVTPSPTVPPVNTPTPGTPPKSVPA